MGNVDARNTHPLWQFSLAVYAAPGVQAECLTLQDANGIDVNLLLYCAWVGACAGRQLSAMEITEAREAVAAWNRDVVQPLRVARRAAKRLIADADPVLAVIAEAELAAERYEQDILYARTSAIAVHHPDATEDCVRRNINQVLADAEARKAPFPDALVAAALAYARDGTPSPAPPHRQTE